MVRSPRSCDIEKAVMDALKMNPCSLNLVPPAKKQRPRTYETRSCQLSLGRRLGRRHENLPALDEKAWCRVSKVTFRSGSDGK